ncbi:MAG TPA: sigma-70 family RNA polymerase sigma factor [Terracidiphilus sp.]|nr:sigma-70 family RNA polymerase sigma factor [Terracidiphilus sp.]
MYGEPQALSEDRDAEFTAIVCRQARFVFRVAYSVLLNSHDAEDVVQETFLKLYRNGGWQKAKNERAFLARVAWRIAVDRAPHISRDRNADTLSNEVAEMPSLLPGPERITLAANEHAVIHCFINALPADLRTPLLLSAFDDFNSREIGEILSIPEGTVRTRLQRARILLRQKLESLEKVSDA